MKFIIIIRKCFQIAVSAERIQRVRTQKSKIIHRKLMFAKLFCVQ